MLIQDENTKISDNDISIILKFFFSKILFLSRVFDWTFLFCVWLHYSMVNEHISEINFTSLPSSMIAFPFQNEN